MPALKGPDGFCFARKMRRRIITTQRYIKTRKKGGHVKPDEMSNMRGWGSVRILKEVWVKRSGQRWTYTANRQIAAFDGSPTHV